MKVSWLATWLLGAVVRCQQTAAVYLPGYGEGDWSALRGSILASDQSLTTYTVFCAEQTPVSCIAGDLPFVFAENTETLIYTASAEGKITADLSCALAETTAATCTGSSSLAAGYDSFSEATSTSWTKTFARDEVTWGTLTLTTPGSTAAASTTRRDPSVTLGVSQTIVSGSSIATATSNAGHPGEGNRVAIVSGLVVFLGFWLC